MKITDDVDLLKGVGPKKKELLLKLNIASLEDFLFYFPRHYQDRRHISEIIDLKDEVPALIRATVVKITTSGFRYGKKSFIKVLCEDRTGKIEIIFFLVSKIMSSFSF